MPPRVESLRTAIFARLTPSGTVIVLNGCGARANVLRAARALCGRGRWQTLVLCLFQRERNAARDAARVTGLSRRPPRSNDLGAGGDGRA